ncbi:MAG: outer membrane lipoprotein carrier protein LolA [Proteobacteria bacterium]|nr:outer membrane lipoprotein carrier protein LolA [Pseudomonadota bacterium]
MNIKIFIISMTLLSVFQPVQSSAVTAEDITGALQKKYRTMKDYRAYFKQEAKIQGYPRPQKSEGEVLYKNPGKMRWNYDKPEKQEIITDAVTLWLYTPALNQVMKTDFSLARKSKLASAFLSGMGNLEEDFNISLDKIDEANKEYRIKLLPKDTSDIIGSLFLTLDSKSFNIKKSELTDIYGNITIVIFSELKINTGLKDSLFDFTPPEGVEIIAPPGTY